MADSREEGKLEEREILLLTIKNFFVNGVSYEVLRASVKDITDEELLAISKELLNKDTTMERSRI